MRRYATIVEAAAAGTPNLEIAPATLDQRARRLATALSLWNESAPVRARRARAGSRIERMRMEDEREQAAEAAFEIRDPFTGMRHQAWNAWLAEWQKTGAREELEWLVQDVLGVGGRPENPAPERSEASREDLAKVTLELVNAIRNGMEQASEATAAAGRRYQAFCRLARAVGGFESAQRTLGYDTCLSPGERTVLERVGNEGERARPEPGLEDVPVVAFIGNYPFNPEEQKFESRSRDTLNGAIPPGNPGTRDFVQDTACVLPVFEFIGTAKTGGDGRSPSFRLWAEHRQEGTGTTLFCALDAKTGSVRIFDEDGSNPRDPESCAVAPSPGEPVFVKILGKAVPEGIKGGARMTKAIGSGPYAGEEADIHSVVMAAAAGLGGPRKVHVMLSEKGQGELYQKSRKPEMKKVTDDSGRTRRRKVGEREFWPQISFAHHAAMVGLSLAGHWIDYTFGAPMPSFDKDGKETGEYALGTGENSMNPGKTAEVGSDGAMAGENPIAKQTMHLLGALTARSPERDWMCGDESFMPVINPTPAIDDPTVTFWKGAPETSHRAWRIGIIAPQATLAELKACVRNIVAAARDSTTGEWWDDRKGRVQIIVDPESYADETFRSRIRTVAEEANKPKSQSDQPEIYIEVRPGDDFGRMALDLVLIGRACPERDAVSFDQFVEAAKSEVPMMRIGEGPGNMTGKVFLTGQRRDRHEQWRLNEDELNSNDFSTDEAVLFVGLGQQVPGLNAFRMSEDLPVLLPRHTKQVTNVLRSVLNGKRKMRLAGRIEIIQGDPEAQERRIHEREGRQYPFRELGRIVTGMER